MKNVFSQAKRFLFSGVVVLIIGVAIASAYYFYQENQKFQALLKNPTEAAKEETKALVAQVGKLLELPQGEEPTLATITDKERLKDQPFFAKAENGDKILIYTQAGKAILYRLSKSFTEQIAWALNGEVAVELPQGETRPEADLLVIIGEPR